VTSISLTAAPREQNRPTLASSGRSGVGTQGYPRRASARAGFLFSLPAIWAYSGRRQRTRVGYRISTSPLSLIFLVAGLAHVKRVMKGGEGKVIAAPAK
jgi:hypothetical protein